MSRKIAAGVCGKKCPYLTRRAEMGIIGGRTMMEAELQALINRYDTIAVISHFRPDGDAIGSTLALGLSLQGMGKKVYMWNEDGVPARYAFLQGAEQIVPTPPELPADVQMVICVDTGDMKRLGDRSLLLLADFPCLVNIDHHGSNTCYGQLNIVEAEAAACACVLHRLLKSWGCPLTREVAAALYVALSTDTGSFQYGSTTAEVMRMGAELLEAGVDVAGVNRRLYQELSHAALRVQGDVLRHMQVVESGAVAYYAMPAGRKAELGVGLEETKDLVDVVRVLQGVKVALIFEDLEDGRIRISLRSKDERINVAAIAAQFGGGGHAMASGIRMRGPLEECCTKVLAAISREIVQLG